MYVHHNYHFLPLYSLLETEEPSSLFGGGRRLWLRKEPQSWRKHIATHTSLDTQPCKDSWNLKKERKKNHGASAWLIVIAPLRTNQVEKKRTGLEKKAQLASKKLMMFYVEHGIIVVRLCVRVIGCVQSLWPACSTFGPQCESFLLRWKIPFSSSAEWRIFTIDGPSPQLQLCNQREKKFPLIENG